VGNCARAASIVSTIFVRTNDSYRVEDKLETGMIRTVELAAVNESIDGEFSMATSRENCMAVNL